jgi:hypothetical protein
MISENNQGPHEGGSSVQVVIDDHNGLTGWNHCETLLVDGAAPARRRLNAGLCGRSLKSPAGPVLPPPAKYLSAEAKDKCDRQE